MTLPQLPEREQAERRCGEIPGQAQKNEIRRKRQTIRKFFKKQFRFTPVISPICGESYFTVKTADFAALLLQKRYATLSLSYEEEQKTLKAAVPELQSFLETETDKTESLQRFIQKVKQVTELKALTPELIHEFVDKIVVYAPRYLDGKRVQLLDIYYSGVGILHELTPEEMEETFQHHLAERNKEKTA